MKSLVRSLSLKLSRENLAAREKDVETPPIVEEEQSEVENAESDGAPQDIASKEEDWFASKEDSSIEEEHIASSRDSEPLTEPLRKAPPPPPRDPGIVEHPAEPKVDHSPPIEEDNESLDVGCQEETEVNGKIEPRENGSLQEEPIESDSEGSQTLPRSRSAANHEGFTHRGRPGLQG